MLGHNRLHPYQSLSFSYPNLINKSPATSLKIFLCASVKYFLHSPVFPERKVGERLGLMADSRASRINWPGRRKRGAGEKVVNDPVQRPGPVIDQILEMDLHHGGLVQPSEIRSETIGDIRKFDIRYSGLPKILTLQACIEIGKRLIIIMMDMPRFHVGHIKDMRNDHIARITKNEIRNECRGANALHHFLACKKMSGGNIAGRREFSHSRACSGERLRPLSPSYSA